MKSSIKNSLSICKNIIEEGWDCEMSSQGFAENMTNIEQRVNAIKFIISNHKLTYGGITNNKKVSNDKVYLLLNELENIIDGINN